MKTLLSDKRAVSPIIGILLLFGVAVILSAVVGTFFLGLGDTSTESTPDTDVDFDYNESIDRLTITHGGGESLDQQNTGFLRVVGATVGAEDQSETPQETGWNTNILTEHPTDNQMAMIDNGQAVRSGIEIASASETEDEVTLVWENSDRSYGQELGSHTLP